MLTKLLHMTLLNSCYVCKNVVIHFSYGMRFGHLYAVQTSERSDWANLNCNVHATPPQLKRHPSHLRASNSFLLTREMLFISNVRFICKIWSMKIWFVENLVCWKYFGSWIVSVFLLNFSDHFYCMFHAYLWFHVNLVNLWLFGC